MRAGGGRRCRLGCVNPPLSTPRNRRDGEEAGARGVAKGGFLGSPEGQERHLAQSGYPRLRPIFAVYVMIYVHFLFDEVAAMRDVSATETAITYALESLWGAAFAWEMLDER
ncbi:hypothetical protein ABZP36_011372 [Zizania latifolia]